MKMAKKNHVLLMAGMPVEGKSVKDGNPLPEAVYDALGQPRVMVTGATLYNHGVRSIAIQSVSR